jgi:hypothetical protein
VTNYLYEARVVPIGRPVTLPDDHGRPRTWTFDKWNFGRSQRYARDIPVWLNHDPKLEIGKLRQLIPQRDWWVCCFEVDEVHRLDPFDVGQNLSVGLAFPADDPTVPSVGEVSIVRRGRVPGAEITMRVERDPERPSPAAARTTTARTAAGEVFYDTPGTIIRRDCGKVLGVR